NGPLAVAVAKLVPALLAGCAVVLKPHPQTPLDAFTLAQACADAGLPPGVLSVLPAERDVSAHLVAHPGVDVVSFTGSTAAGREVGRVCGAQLKHAHLELGGRSAALVLEDVAADEVAPAVLGGGMLANSGQSCYALTRVLVPAARYDDHVDAL